MENILKNKKVLFALLAITIIVVFASIFLLTSPKKIDLSNYLIKEVEIKGLDDYGYIDDYHLFDYSLLKKDIAMSKNKSNKSIDNMSDEQALMHIASSIKEYDEIQKELQGIIDSITFVYSVNGKKVNTLEELSNGDEVKVEVSSKDAVNSYFHIKLVPASYEFKVKGLKKGKIIDLFDSSMFTYSFEGANGKGKVEYTTSYDDNLDPYISYIYIEDEKEYYSNGDEVTFHCRCDREALAEAGYGLKSYKKKVIVEGLGEEVTDPTKVNKESLRKFVDLTLKACQKRESSPFTYYASYLCIPKDSSPSLVVVFTTENMIGKIDYYYVEYNAITMDNKGVLKSKYYDENKIPYAGWALGGESSFKSSDNYQYEKIDFTY